MSFLACIECIIYVTSALGTILKETTFKEAKNSSFLIETTFKCTKN